MIKRKNGFLLVCAILVIAPVVLVWSFAWPMLSPVPFPALKKGHMIQPEEHSLEANQVQLLGQWLQQHKSSWGKKGEKPPGVPSVQFLLEGKDHQSLYLSFWHFRHGDDVAGYQTAQDGPYRMSSVNKEPLTKLMKNFPDVPWKAKK